MVGPSSENSFSQYGPASQPANKILLFWRQMRAIVYISAQITIHLYCMWEKFFLTNLLFIVYSFKRSFKGCR